MTIARIPWPGPRPLTKDDLPSGAASVLIGRERELRELADVCQSFHIVEITAPSGVGKTSFIAFAVLRLREEGAAVIIGRAWSDALLELPDAGAARARALYCIAIGAGPEAAGRPLGDVLRERAGEGQPVVVLDQFEELLRYNHAIGQAMLELVEETAHEAGVTHIVISRSEFRDELRPLEEGRAAVWHMALSEIEDHATLARIIAEPAASKDVTVGPEEVKTILGWWDEARSEVVHETLTEVGLLQLQALLWSFREWAKKTSLGDASRIAIEDLNAFRNERLALSTSSNVGGELIKDAVDHYVADVIERLTSDPPTLWKNGPRLMLARVAPFFTSAGYKIPQAFSSLLPLAVHEELDPEQRQALRELGGSATSQREALSGFSIDGSGIAHDWPSAKIGQEMLASLDAGLEALSRRDANLLRVFTQRDDAIYELVHDGLGAALERWAARLLEKDPISAIGLIADRNGQAMRRDLSPETFIDDGGTVDPRWGPVTIDPEDGRAVIEWLRWTGNKVSGCAFTNLVFRNCWFVGSVFEEVSFTNVTFEHCVMRGVAMRKCEFDSVDFTGDVCNGEKYTLDTLTVVGANEQARVAFNDLRATTGLFLTQLKGGEWTFRDANAEHVRLYSEGQPISLRFERSTLRHVTLDTGEPDAATVEILASTIDPVTDAHGVLATTPSGG